MAETSLQYASGEQYDNIEIVDVQKAIEVIQKMDDEHGAFWVLVFTEEENVIEVDKDLSVIFLYKGIENNYQASDWIEVEELFNLLLQERFDDIIKKIK